MFAFGLNSDDGSEWRRGIVRSVERGAPSGDSRFIDLSGMSAKRAVARLKEAKLQLLIDFNGFTTDEHAEFLATRPAAVVMQAVGYPGTMGSRFVDYILLDRNAAPPHAASAISERMVLIPNCYQVNSHRLHPLPHAPPGSRGEEGQSEVGASIPLAAGDSPRQLLQLVNFNQLYKLSSAVFSPWCSALARSPHTALWLLRQPPEGEPLLRAELASCGIAHARRLHFADLLADIPAHLTRTSRAHLLVDTPEYNCHTTGSDALWAGVPSLTVAGAQMASRVGKSLVQASSVAPGLTRSMREYTSLAVYLTTRT